MTLPAAHRVPAGICERREWWFPALLALFFIIVGTAPYWYGYANTPKDHVFMGFVGRGTSGANGYLMLAKQAQDGYHLMENKMTPEPLTRTYPNLEWWIYGKAARWTGLSLIAIFHLGRILTVLGFMGAVYYLVAQCLETVYLRRLALAFICFGTGFGWIIWMLNYPLPVELILPRDIKGVTVAAYLVNKPHFMRATACAALKCAFLLAGERTGKRRYFVYSGLAALAHSSIRPYHIPETYLVYALFPVFVSIRDGHWSVRRFANYALAGLMLLPAVLYFACLAVAGTLGMSGWERVPGFLLEYILWLGWPFLLCCAALPYLLRLRGMSNTTLLLTLWLMIAWLICNAYPYWGSGHESCFHAFQYCPPLLVLGTLLPWTQRHLRAHPRIGIHLGALVSTPLRRGVLAAMLVLVSMPSAPIAFARMFTDLKYEAQRDSRYYIQRYYISEALYDALTWLDEHAAEKDVVLASHATSQFIPRLGRSKAVTGHDMLTADYFEKNRLVEHFFSTDGDEDFKRWLVTQFSVDYVVYGELERQWGPINLGRFPWLKPVYRAGEVTVYRVLHNDR